jgi:hypothetical protein
VSDRREGGRERGRGEGIRGQGGIKELDKELISLDLDVLA